MQRSCVVCDSPFEAKRESARYCGGACRKRAQRGGRPDTPEGQPPTIRALPESAEPSPDQEGDLVTSVTSSLRDAGRLDSYLGQSALALARRIEDGRDTGSAIASLNREMRATLTDALKGTATPTSAVTQHKDELAARRQRA